MMDGNPDIADLSDPFRPTKLAEEFREIYDDDWTHAYEELDTNSKPESDNIDTLTYLIKEIQTFCTYSSSQQINAMEKVCKDELVNPKVHILKHSGIMCGKTPSEMNNTQLEITHRMICDLRKSMGTLSVRPLVQIFHEKWVIRMKQEEKLPSTSKHIENFVAKAFEVIWLMTIQNPPMIFKWQKRDEPVDKERFTFYTKRGNTIKQTVWPAVLLHESGPLMSKGIVQAQ
ncbi:uncharacterized protein LOC132760244 [Ruditapes philippinarum]|uniref:uncharacterized protein LOC132760244 n=1 Tax=Ruditapes philippinarum TaxID=129788 RepID=UPI00295BF5E5|nr:uncharacterized protein LOC132760244 [Ruditapes philippinarum]